MSQVIAEDDGITPAELVSPAVDTTQSATTPVVATEREVVFSTTAALSVPPATIRRRWAGASVMAGIRRLVITTLAEPPRRRPLGPSTRASLEAARMSREMDRL
jgi:hypothetical protein